MSDDESMRKPILQSLAVDDEGSALIEGAIMVPVLCVLVFGIYEFSWFFYQQHLISTGLRDAARYVARLPTACDPISPDWPIPMRPSCPQESPRRRTLSPRFPCQGSRAGTAREQRIQWRAFCTDQLLVSREKHHKELW